MWENRVTNPRNSPRQGSLKGRFLFILIVLLLGGGAWYYFFGQKPQVALSVALAHGTGEDHGGMWALDRDEVVVLANRELKLIDIKRHTLKWTTKMRPAAAVDPAWRNAINARFVRLQQWADELARKRAALRTADETKAFNEEAAKYQAELVAARAESQQPRAPSAPVSKVPAKPAAMAVAQKLEEPPYPALRPVANPEVQLIEERMRRRQKKLGQLQLSFATKKAAARTEIQRAAVREEEARYATLNAEQQADQDAWNALQGKVKPPQPVASQEPEPPPEEEDTDLFDKSEPFAAALGDLLWIVEGERLSSFDRASGTLKSDSPLAGPVVQAWRMQDEIYVVAAAGRGARQLTKITAKGPVSLYTSAGSHGQTLGFSGGGDKPKIPRLRTEFSGLLVRADIRLMTEKLTQRDAIKPGSDAALIDTISNSAAGSTDEILAMSKLIANDGQRLAGNTKVWIDESTYEVTLRRPFDPAVAEWKGTVQGQIALLATAQYHLLAGGTKLFAFNRANQKIWEATLGAPMAEHEDGAVPVVESGDRIYFADGAFLTAFEAASGKVLWRVPSVGIRKIQLDSDGNVYVHSLNQSVDSLKYAADASHSGVEPVTMKITPEDGKINWQVEKYQDLWVSGSDVYVLRQGSGAQDVEEAVFSGKGPEARVKIYKLRRGSGSPIWEWFQPRMPSAVHADRKNVSLLFRDELQLIHSIAL